MMNISKVRQVMLEEGIVFSFSGIISQALTEFMIETASKQLSDEIDDKSSAKAIFLISIELLQNIG